MNFFFFDFFEEKIILEDFLIQKREIENEKLEKQEVYNRMNYKITSLSNNLKKASKNVKIELSD